MKIKLFKIYLLLDIVLIVLSFFIGNYWFINTQVAFLISVFIAYVSIRSYENMINSELATGKYDNIEEDEEIKVNTLKKGVTFFSPLKILGYILLGVSFYLLNKLGMLNSLAFLVGVLPMPLGSIIYGVLDVADTTES